MATPVSEKPIELGDFRVQVDARWVRYTEGPQHPASAAFHDREGPHELVLTHERVQPRDRTLEAVISVYARGKILTARRGSITSMAAGELDDADVVGPVREEKLGASSIARQWAHTGDGSIVVAVLGANVVPDAYSCLGVSVICNVPVDLEMVIERLLSDVLANVAVHA